MQEEKENIILEPKTRVGRNYIYANGDKYTFVKILDKHQANFIIQISSVKTKIVSCVKCEKDENFIVKLQ